MPKIRELEVKKKVVEEGKPGVARELVWYLLLVTAFILLGLYWKIYIDLPTLVNKIGPIAPKLAVAIITLFSANLFIKVTNPIFRRTVSRHFKSEEWRVILSLYGYFIWLIAGLIIITGIFGSFSSLGISLSLIGAGVALALQQVILSFAAWFLIMIKRPYKIGDRIYIKGRGILGDVEDVTMLFTVLKEVSDNESTTGKNVIVPNSTVFLEPIENYSYDVPHIWVSIPVSVTYESDLALAEEIIFNVAKDVAGEEMKKAAGIIRRKTPESVHAEFAREDPVIRVEFADSSHIVTARIMCLPKQTPSFKTEVYRNVFHEFSRPENKDKVEIAYPHMELVLHDEVMGKRAQKFFERK